MSIEGKQSGRKCRDCKFPFRKKRKVAYRYFQEFSDVTTLHGVRYVAEPNRHPIENQSVDQEKRLFNKVIHETRLFWATVIVLCTVWCGIQIQLLWTRWKTSPVIVSLSERSTKIWNIPFPAITICPENKIRRSMFDIEKEMAINDVEERDNISSSDYFSWQTASMVCSKRAARLFNDTEHLHGLNQSHMEHLFELSPQFGDIIRYSKWGQGSVNVSSMFRPILTDGGVCFTFNLLENEDLFTSQVRIISPLNGNRTTKKSSWHPETGYDKEADIKESFPFRAVSNGHDSGIKMLLRVDPEDMQTSCNGDAQSFKLIVHPVSEFPQVQSQFIRLPLDSEVGVAVRPDMITTAHGLRDDKPEVRGCYFPHEKKLKYFKVYTEQNCEMECLIEPFIIVCECLPYHLPSNGSNEFPLCSQRDRSCLEYLEDAALNWIANVTEKTGNLDPFCSCLPSCSEYKYHLEMSMSQFNISNDLRNEVPRGITSRYRYIKLSIFFKDKQFIHSHRSEIYSTLDFLANCGGLLGLFTGFSITSAIEICYFLSMRLACNLRRHRQERRDDTKSDCED